MAKIYNSDLFKELKDGAKIQQSVDRIPSEIAEKVVPVIEVNPKLLKRCNIVRRNTATNATSATILAVPSDRDFYLVGVSLSVIKDATATSAASGILATTDGVSSNILQIASLTLTAQSESITLSPTFPLKVDRGTNITVTNTTNVANVSAVGVIWGYYDDLINA